MTIYITHSRFNQESLHRLLKQPREQIAEGFYGIVFKIEFEGNYYALKMFKDTMKDAKYFDYEILEDLHHLPYFPTMFAFSDETWMLTEFIEGKPLRFSQHINSYSLDVLDMYRSASENGWLANDIKGDNIVVDESSDLIIIVDVGYFLPMPREKVDLANRAAWVMANAHRFPSVSQPL